MKPAFWARRAHKWIGLIIGVQALLWMVSGAYMTVISLDSIRGDLLAPTSGAPLRPSPEWIGPKALSDRYPGMESYRLRHFLDKEVYEIHQRDQVVLIDARDGARISPLDKATARALGQSMYQGDAGIRSVEWITEAPQEVAAQPVPMWAVAFADSGDTTLYLSPDTGELLALRHSIWRWFDFMWMFHIMDYETHSDTGNNLLRVATVLGLVFALSGVWLLLYSFRRRSAA